MTYYIYIYIAGYQTNLLLEDEGYQPYNEFPHSLKEGGQHIRHLENSPWQNEVWRKKYPKIAEYLTWDPDTEQRFPHYARIVNNVFINHKPININFDHENPKYKNRVENNAELTVDPSMLTAEHIPELLKMAMESCPEFKEIPTPLFII
jgi:hypothetical protein